MAPTCNNMLCTYSCKKGVVLGRRGRTGEPLFATSCCNTSIATWSTPSEPPHQKPFFEVNSCCGFWLWSWLAVVNLFVLNLVCFVAPVNPKRAGWRDMFSPEGGCSEGLDAFRFFSTQTLELYIPRLSRCTTQ